MKLLLAPIFCIILQEMLGVIYFKEFGGIPFSWVVVYTVLQGLFFYFWGSISDALPRKLCLFLTLMLGLVPIVLFKYNIFWSICTSFLLLPAPICRAILADHKIHVFGMLLSTKNLMKLSWLAAYVTWMSFFLVNTFPIYSLFILWGLSCISIFFLPKTVQSQEKLSKRLLNAFKVNSVDMKMFWKGLIAFSLFELIFFIMWSFSEKIHVFETFYPFVGASCFLGTLFSFFLDKKEKQLEVIRFSYFNVMLICGISIITAHFFQNQTIWWIVVSVVAAAGGVYLPYFYSQAITFFGAHEKGKACGTAEIFSSIPEIFGSLLVLKIISYTFLSYLLLIISIVGYYLHAKQKSKELLDKLGE